ncbi:MAG: glutamate formimidoyltransferase [Chloroflexota bacterium]|nr:glutamate formimidoyltransferase [Chloroflexota bacterium]MDH5243680.1 glutamate formimidoyltransferase [Chloroflexota bacterium]
MLIESVPNVSEGRRLDVVDRLASAITSVDGVFLLDRTSDASHNRSVFTLAGEDPAVREALERLVEAAIHEIDMDVHEGEHPRIGAVDVIPFVPLTGTTIDDCVELARTFGARMAERFGLPVYLYARAATRGDREKLADVRRGQYEGLKAEIGQHGREPDFGPTRMHPSAGAVAVGARPFLIAYNINLASSDVDLAKRIARRVRESGGGLPKLQANGFEVREPERGHPLRAQVSMNLLDFSVTPLWLVWDSVRELAAEDGVALAESELIGLAPLAAFLDVADHAGASTEDDVERRLAAAAEYLALRDFAPSQALEVRLESARAERAEGQAGHRPRT